MSYLQIVASMPSGLPPAHFDCYLALADWGRMPIRSLGHEEQQCIDRSQPLATITSADMDCEPESPLHDNASTNHHVRRPCTTITMADIHPVPVSPLHAADCCTANVIWRWCACSVCSADKSIDGKNSNPVLLTLLSPLQQIGRPSRQRKRVFTFLQAGCAIGATESTRSRPSASQTTCLLQCCHCCCVQWMEMFDRWPTQCAWWARNVSGLTS